MNRPCPSWCTRQPDHIFDVDPFGTLYRVHEWRLPVFGDLELLVLAEENIEDADTPVTLELFSRDDQTRLSADQARQLAAALLAAAALLETATKENR